MENIARPVAAVNVLAVAGSLRRNSFNRQLLAAAAAAAPSGLNIRVFDAIDEIPLFNEDLETGPHKAPSPVVELRQAVASADGFMVATPEYNQSIPAVAKNLIDWLSRTDTEVLANKPTALLGAAAGASGTRLARAACFATERWQMPGSRQDFRTFSLRLIGGFDGTNSETKVGAPIRYSAFQRCLRGVQTNGFGQCTLSC